MISCETLAKMLSRVQCKQRDWKCFFMALQMRIQFLARQANNSGIREIQLWYKNTKILSS
jgi:hypothetical protein